jgi:hypothetical protein
MNKRFAAGILALLMSAGPAAAQVTCSGTWPPATLTSGASASAADVMSNFTYLYNCLTGATVPSAPVPRSHLAGLTLSTMGSSSSLAVAVGQAADGTNADMMSLASALTKTTSAWTVGNNQGGLDSGTIAANSWYHVHLIKRTDGTVGDVLFSTSATAPTSPTNYSLFRRIGAARTNGSSQWTAFPCRDCHPLLGASA